MADVDLTKDRKSDTWIITTTDGQGFHRQLNVTREQMERLENLLWVELFTGYLGLPIKIKTQQRKPLLNHDEALDKTKKLLRTLVPDSTEYNLAIYDADEKGDMNWFKMQLDELIKMSSELKEAL